MSAGDETRCASADRLKAVAVRARVRVAVAAEALVAIHPVPREDRGGEGDLAGEGRAGADLGELLRLALAVATEQLQAVALRWQGRTAAVGANDKAGQGDRTVVVAIVE